MSGLAMRSSPLAALVGVLLASGAGELVAQDVLAAVVDETTGRPIAAARVEIIGVEGGPLGLTDDAGRLTLYTLEAGTLALRASALGYAAADVELEVPETGFVSAIFSLPPAPVELEGLSVEVALRVPYLRRSGFYERSSSNRGYFYDAERMDGMPATSVVGKLRSLRRVRRLRDGRIAVGQCRNPNIWLDRLFVETQDLDRAMRAEDVIGVEVYDQAQLVPPRFRAGGACAAIVIWSVRR